MKHIIIISYFIILLTIKYIIRYTKRVYIHLKEYEEDREGLIILIEFIIMIYLCIHGNEILGINERIK